MALIKSISGIRGTIGGKPGSGLTPIDIVRFTTAYAAWIGERGKGRKIIIGRDGRISGELVRNLVVSTLQGMGYDVVDLGLSTTPTVEMAVVWEGAAGGIILTASHNPKEWNALKLLNERGEFISGDDGAWILHYAEKGEPQFVEVTKLGSVTYNNAYMQRHIDELRAHPLVDVAAIRSKGFKVVVDAINSTGAIFVPALLHALGVDNVTVINEEVNGKFAHNPEPLPEHLRELSAITAKSGCTSGHRRGPRCRQALLCVRRRQSFWRRIHAGGCCRLHSAKQERQYGQQYEQYPCPARRDRKARRTILSKCRGRGECGKQNEGA